MSSTMICRLCGSSASEPLRRIRQRPAGEVDYKISAERYDRTICQCRTCGVYFNAHSLLPADFYRGQYNKDSYRERALQRYEFIRSLPEEQSDNKQRALRIDRFIRARNFSAPVTILDVGMGLCVFLAEMKTLGYHCSGIDPDPQAVRHARDVVGLTNVFAGTLDEWDSEDRFDVITLNKVLEHVQDPVQLLRGALTRLRQGGLVYAEVPDGDLALQHGDYVERAEFNVEHLAIYTPAAMSFLAKSAGLSILEMSSIVEPSGKATLFAFLVADTLKESSS